MSDIVELEKRITALERDTHAPVDFVRVLTDTLTTPYPDEYDQEFREALARFVGMKYTRGLTL